MRIKWFVFLQRAAFIANLFFILFVLLRALSFKASYFTSALILSIGFVLSPLLNISIAFLFLILMQQGKRNAAPIWITTFNLFWLIFQFVYFLVI